MMFRSFSQAPAFRDAINKFKKIKQIEEEEPSDEENARFRITKHGPLFTLYMDGEEFAKSGDVFELYRLMIDQVRPITPLKSLDTLLSKYEIERIGNTNHLFYLNKTKFRGETNIEKISVARSIHKRNLITIVEMLHYFKDHPALNYKIKNHKSVENENLH